MPPGTHGVQLFYPGAPPGAPMVFFQPSPGQPMPGYGYPPQGYGMPVTAAPFIPGQSSLRFFMMLMFPCVFVVSQCVFVHLSLMVQVVAVHQLESSSLSQDP